MAGLEVSAKMLPATEVDGDYYEVLPVDDGCWIGIGDVASHGLRTGLIMLQAQSAIDALVRRDPEASLRKILSEVNGVLFETVRHRLGSDEHMTLSLVRYRVDGTLVSAGAHEETLIGSPRSAADPRVGLATSNFDALECRSAMVMSFEGV